MSAILPGVNSSVSLTPTGGSATEFSAAVNIDSTEEIERIDVTGFGATSRVFTTGLKAATEVTIRTYADAVDDLAVGDTLSATSIKFGGSSGYEITGAATVVTYSASADVDGAAVYEIGLLYT
tara:strand:- start:8924 stop:9292 length:369 start_codon:yes stop_codon:yes gene_type:complete